MIRFKQISKRYNDGQLAVDNLNLTIGEGEFAVLIGPSGSGKTTTMKMINRLIEPTKGVIYIKGKDYRKQSPVSLRRQIGYVIQQIGLFPHMTIGENISLVPRLMGFKPDKYMEKVDSLLNLVELDPAVYRERYPQELSGGQQQRVGVVRALAADAPIILMDEPFSALDPITREQLQDELIRLQQEVRKTIVFVTHDMDEALKLADTIVLMRDGRVEQKASPEEMLRNPATDFVKDFIGKERLRSPREITLDDVMIKSPVTIEPFRGLAESLSKMRRRGVDSLLVTDKDRVLLGIVTAKDIHNNIKNKELRVSDVMTKDPISVGDDQGVSELMSRFQENNVGYVPVLTNEGKVKGLVTRASLVDIIAEQWEGY